MPTPSKESITTKLTRKPTIPRATVSIRQSITATLTKSTISKPTALSDVINKDPTPTTALSKESRKLTALTFVKPSRANSAEAESPKGRDSTGEKPLSNSVRLNQSPVKQGSTNSPRGSVNIRPPSNSSRSSPTTLRNNNRHVNSSNPSTIATTAAATSGLKPRSSNASALPKYKPKTALSVPKDKPTNRKRRSSAGDKENEDSEQRDTVDEIASRPISPLPRRSRLASLAKPPVATTLPQRASPPKARDTTPTQLTPTKSTLQQSIGGHTRTRTISTTTTSSGARGSRKVETPIKRVEKRPRLNSETKKLGSQVGVLGASTTTPTRNNVGHSSASVITLPEEMSSDSISIDDVSALLDVSPRLSPHPTPPITRSIKRGSKFLSPGSSNGGTPKTPSRRGLPSRKNMSYLSPLPPNAAHSPALRPPMSRGGNDRGSILSWEQMASFHSDLEVDALLQEVPAPFKAGANNRDSDISFTGLTPSFSRERIDSGWGAESPPSFFMTRSMTRATVARSLVDDSKDRLSIGQVLFPSQEQDESDNDNTASAVKLLRLQLDAADDRAQGMLEKIALLEEQLRHAKEDADKAQERETAKTSRAAASLEIDLTRQRQTLAEKEAAVQVLANRVRELEEIRDSETSDYERRLLEGHEKLERLNSELERRVAEKIESAVQKSLEQERKKWQAKQKVSVMAVDTARTWQNVQSSVRDELAAIRQARETLSVFLAGLECYGSQSTKSC